MAKSKKWYQTSYTYVWVFNTGRGLSICIRFPHNVGVLYDLGASQDFSPSSFVEEHIAPKLEEYGLSENDRCKIAQCFMSHPHADHIGEIDKVIEENGEKPTLYPCLLTCPNDRCKGEDVDFSRIETQDNKKIIAKYRQSYQLGRRTPPLQAIRSEVPCHVPEVEYGFYYMDPPAVDKLHKDRDQDYGNGLSLVLYLRHRNQTLLIPGDITPAVFDPVLSCAYRVEKRYTYFSIKNDSSSDYHKRTSGQPTLKELLGERGLSVLVAPHHGLESGFSEELFNCIKGGKPMINVISEKRHLSESDGEVSQRYQKKEGAFGLPVDIDGKKEEQCFSVSTRNGHHILLVFEGTNRAPRVYLRTDPEDLLEIV